MFRFSHNIKVTRKAGISIATLPIISLPESLVRDPAAEALVSFIRRRPKGPRELPASRGIESFGGVAVSRGRNLVHSLS